MAVTDLGSHTQFSSSTTCVFTCVNAVPSGTLVVVFVSDNITTVTGNGVTDSKGNTYTQTASATASGAGIAIMYHSFITNALTTSDTITYTNPNISASQTTSTCGVSAPGYNAIDSATTNTNTGFSAAYTVTGLGAAAVTNEIYFGYAMTTGGGPVNAASGWTSTPPTFPVTTGYAAWQINAGTSALTFNGTLTSGFWDVIIASFKPAPPAQTLHPQIWM